MATVPSSARSATKWRDHTIIDLLGKVQRCRPLSDEETNLLERTVRRIKPKRSVWFWHPSEDQQILNLMARRRRRRIQPKPYQRNDEIRLLALHLGRTEWAVRRRMERLRKAKRGAAK